MTAIMKCTVLEQPCRNFQILGIEKINDPRDGREKVVLSNYASGATGSIVLIDLLTGQGEAITLPGDNGAWALLNWNDEKLLVGTCSQFGYLHCLDLRTRNWAEPLRDPNEKYIWNLVRGSDDMVYGGTYPGCVLLRYDPRRHILENMGRLSEDRENLYSRNVYGDIPGHILVGCGTATPHLALWSMETHRVKPFPKPSAEARQITTEFVVGSDLSRTHTSAQLREITPEFICTETAGKLDFYDTRTLAPIAADLSDRLTRSDPSPVRGMGLSIKLNDGGLVGVRGQQYVFVRKKGTPAELQPIPAERPATSIHTLVSDSHGKIWGASAFGQTIFSYDPATGQTWNSEVVTNHGGEVYGMAFARGKLFLSCYSGGDHVVYDPAQPWDQLNNLNPQTLAPVGPALIRPSARSMVGPDGHFWTGWMAQYGVYGGGLSRVNVETLEMTSWSDPVPKQAIGHLASDDRYLYFITTGDANGLTPRSGPFHLAVWDPAECRIAHEIVFDPAERPFLVVPVAGCVLVQMGGEKQIRVFDPRLMRFAEAIPIEEPSSLLIRCGESRVAVFIGTRLFILDMRSRCLRLSGEIPAPSYLATVTPRGDIYFASGLNLYRATGLSEET